MIVYTAKNTADGFMNEMKWSQIKIGKYHKKIWVNNYITLEWEWIIEAQEQKKIQTHNAQFDFKMLKKHKINK